MSTALKVQNLRALLAEKLGSSLSLQSPIQATCLTGFEALDRLQVPQGAITEIIAPSDQKMGGGMTLLLYGLLSTWLKQQRAVLIDGKDSFSPHGLTQQQLEKLLWSRCTGAQQALKVADLIVRDGNIPLVILLLALNRRNELLKIPATSWHRLQLLAQKSGVTLLVMMPQAQVSCARLRLIVSPGFPLNKLCDIRDDLQSKLILKEERRRL